MITMEINLFILYMIEAVCYVQAYVHPIEVWENHFVDSVTRQQFFIKGVDYQPGGSSSILEEDYKIDPLSDPEVCSRDIILFQELGINTIRVYSINPSLNHDVCMSMLATAGIYLLLDVNSPLLNHHLNRYEPWTTYTELYLENIFRTVEQFSYYNNTLGFFAGNEIVNDGESAENSPSYVKAVIRDLKNYIDHHSPRSIPVGYSAADDLRFRVSFSSYLECSQETPYDSVDFYGVNSYQWCGKQTFYTSGYNLLLSDYFHYTKPVFLSEYGCNEITPRIFDEVQAIHSKYMSDIFSGGLAYEFTNEANNYGLVEVQDNGDIKLLPDFFNLKNQYDSNSQEAHTQTSQLIPKVKDYNIGGFYQFFNYEICNKSYPNLKILKELPKAPAVHLVNYGEIVQRGNLISLTDEQLMSRYKIFSHNGALYTNRNKIKRIIDLTSESILKTPTKMRNGMYNYSSLPIIIVLTL